LLDKRKITNPIPSTYSSDLNLLSKSLTSGHKAISKYQKRKTNINLKNTSALKTKTDLILSVLGIANLTIG
jgi:hypothetical protein